MLDAKDSLLTRMLFAAAVLDFFFNMFTDVTLLPAFRSIMTLGPLSQLDGVTSLPLVLGSCDAKSALNRAGSALAVRAVASF
jgi:hypothetical protein